MSAFTSARSLLRAALLAGVASAASAQTVTISANQTTPIVTSTAGTGTPANVTINSGISVTVAGGTAATIDSNNTLINGGTIANSGTSNVVGVKLDSGLTSAGNFTNNGLVQITGTGGSGNIGLWVTGPNPLTGTIAGTTSSRFSVTGDSATGVLIAAPFTGNVTLGAVSVGGSNSRGIVVNAPLTGNLQTYRTISASGTGNTGIAILAPISGRFTSGSAIVVGADASLNAQGQTVPAVAGVAGVQIAASVGGGFVNDRYLVDASGVVVPSGTANATTIVATITSYAGAPALLVAPVGTDPISLGAVATGNDAFAIVNRGNLSAIGRNSGTAQTAVLIGRDALAAGSVVLAGGISNQANANITASAVDAAATGITLASGASVPAIVNAGNISVTAAQTAAVGTTPAGAGGAATAILVRSGSSLDSISNSGTITAKSSGNSGAWGIRDLSGSLTSISNSGTIEAAALTGQTARAIDLSASSAAVAISNSGSIKGDIVGGSGATGVTLTGGSVTGALALGSGANSLTMSGGASIGGAVTSGGQLAISLSGATTLDLSKGTAPTLSSLSQSGSSVLVIGVASGQPGLTVTGAASFTGTSRLRLAVGSVAQTQQLTVLTAAGGITAEQPATLVDTASTPFLYTLGNVNVGSNVITATLNRKTAAQVGLAPGVANFFDQSLVALAGDSTLGPAIANLPTQAALLAAYRVLQPASFSQAPLRMAAAMNDAGFANVSQRLAALRLSSGDGSERGKVGLWAQEYGNFQRQRDGSNLAGFNASMLGLSIGVDVPFAGLDAVGIAFNAGWSDVSTGGISGKPLLITAKQVDVYAGKSFGGLFVAVQGSYASTNYSTRREYSIGNRAGVITGAWRGTSYGATGTIGYTLKIGRLAIIPSDSIAWLQVKQNGFTEAGAGALAVTLDKNSQSITTNTAALTADYVLPAGDGAWRLGVRGGYVSQIGTSALALTGRFAGGNTPFTLSADAVRPSELQVGAQIGYAGAGWAGVLGYDRRQASGYTAQAIIASFRIVL